MRRSSSLTRSHSHALGAPPQYLSVTEKACVGLLPTWFGGGFSSWVTVLSVTVLPTVAGLASGRRVRRVRVDRCRRAICRRRSVIRGQTVGVPHRPTAGGLGHRSRRTHPTLLNRPYSPAQAGERRSTSGWATQADPISCVHRADSTAPPEGREFVPQAPVEAVGFEAERPGAEPPDAEPSSSRPGTRPGDHPTRTR